MNPIGGTSQTQNQNPFAPYNAYRDCSQGICTIYCPQWCYLIFPPPPPFALDDDASHGSDFSPLIIALVGALASAFILVAYYVVVSKYCRRGRSRGSSRVSLEFNENRSEANQEASCEATSAGLDEAVIRSISVYKYKKGESLCEGTDCSVCLSEFQENETLRLLPKCSHAFHVTCIDTWLKSHSSCPLCRASIASNNGPPNPVPDQIHENSQAAALAYHRRNDHVLVIGDLGDGSGQDRVLVVAEDGSKTEIVQEREGIQIGQETANTNSSPVGSSIYQNQFCVADILSITEEEEASRLQPPNGFGSNT